MWTLPPPIDGEANDMVLKLLADHFDVPKSSLRIIGGKTARLKLIELIGKK